MTTVGLFSANNASRTSAARKEFAGVMPAILSGVRDLRKHMHRTMTTAHTHSRKALSSVR